MTSIHYVENHFTLHSYLSMTPIPYTYTSVPYTPDCLWPLCLILQVFNDKYTLYSLLSMTTYDHYAQPSTLQVVLEHHTLCSWLFVTTLSNAPGYLGPPYLMLKVVSDHYTIPNAPGCLYIHYTPGVSDHYSLYSRLSMAGINYTPGFYDQYPVLQLSVISLPHTAGCLWAYIILRVV